ncbi:GAF domain-containing protein [Candidatus Chloroploca sp. M-50]|uniref:GAF domain-containing protein n=1 Tax=Candidatus Chloroploca mongolica TaxID=2528176 RepID=A0ABS4D6Y7_9CHLR|nr:HD domain-containing phosphohydrolase [Candidatus Chloroploca mongolica]MBP1465212.1 GAF domain-containing protein [Candidatus Chloroploca mongolica]
MEDKPLTSVDVDSIAQLQRENADLRARLLELEEVIGAVRDRKVDALVMSGAWGKQIFTARTADQTYRTLIEAMSEGALLVSAQGIVIYCNRRFAEMLMTIAERVTASRLQDWVTPTGRKFFQSLLYGGGRGEFLLEGYGGVKVPVLLSSSEVQLADGEHLLCVIATDLTEQRRHQLSLEVEHQARVELEQSERARRTLLSLLEDQKRIRSRYQSIFQFVPVSIWEEDWTAVIAMIRALRQAGVTDFQDYFAQHSDRVNEALHQIRVLDVNDATLKIFKAQSKSQMLKSIATKFAIPETMPGFVQQLLALANGETVFATEMMLSTASLERLYVLQTMVFPSLDSDTGTVLVSLMDITRRKEDEQRIAENARRHQILARLSVQISAPMALEAKLQILTDGLREAIGAQIALTFLAAQRSLTRPLLMPSFGADDAQCQQMDHAALGSAVLAYLKSHHHLVRLTQAELEKLSMLRQLVSHTEPCLLWDGLLASLLPGNNGEPLGCVMLSRASSGAFSVDDEAVLIQINQMVAGVVEQDWLLKVTRQRLNELEAVYAVVRSLRVVPTYRELLDLFLEKSRTILGFTASFFLWRDLNAYQLVPMAMSGDFADLSLLPLEQGEAVVQTLINAGEILLVDDFQTDPRIDGSLRHQMPPGWQGICAVVESSNLIEGILILATPVGSGERSYSPHLFATLLDIFGNSLHRVRLQQDAQMRAEHLALINQLGRDLSSTFDLPTIYATVSATVQKLFPDVEAILLSRYDAERHIIIPAHIYHDGQTEDLTHVPPVALEPPGWGTHSEAIHTRRPVILPHYQEAISRVKSTLSNTGAELIQSAIFVPMLAKDAVVGVLALQDRQVNRFGETDAELLTWVANTTAIALHNAELFCETLKKIEQQQALRMIDMAITSSMDLSITLDLILNRVTTLQDVAAATILLLQPYSHELRFAAGYGFQTDAVKHSLVKIGGGLSGTAALEQCSVRAYSTEEISAHWIGDRFYEREGFTHYLALPLIAKGQVQGVLEIFDRKPIPEDQNWMNFLEVIAGQSAIAIDNATMFENLQRANTELALAYDKTIEGWSYALDLRDKETEGHSLRVTELTLHLARAVGMSDEELVHIRRGALLHDIGKMGIPDAILLKSGPLTPEEWEIMKRHPTYAYELLYPITYLRPALAIPYCHHEKWDGTGYPRGLKGEAIPLAARLFAIVDVWDALRSDRPYRKAWPEGRVREHLAGLSDTHFDPQVVELFFRILNEEA